MNSLSHTLLRGVFFSLSLTSLDQVQGCVCRALACLSHSLELIATKPFGDPRLRYERVSLLNMCTI